MKTIKKIMKLKISRIFVFFLFLFCFENCSSQSKKQQQYSVERDKAFVEYLQANNIPFKKLSDSVFNSHYGNFLKYEKTIKLEKNPYLKVNEVYVHYRTPTSVEFAIYSDQGTVCLSTSDLNIDGRTLSFPINGVVKVLDVIKVEDFGNFDITGNDIKTRKRNKTPFREWYDYVNGTIKNDTIYFTKKFVGTDDYKFKKKWLTKTRKTDFKEIYQPNLKARKYINGAGLINYEVTGEFNVEK